MDIRNVKVSVRMGGAVDLVCEYDGARYHIWIDPESLEHVATYRRHPELYKEKKK